MKKVLLFLVLALAITAGTAVVTVVATDQAMAAGYDGRCTGTDAC
jgi:hypothetical protein